MQAFEKVLRAHLDPERSGFALRFAKGAGLEAARGSTDFGEYFLYFSFFIISAAILLAALFFRLGLEQRIKEIGLLQASGFPIRLIRSFFLLEAGLLSLLFGATTYTFSLILAVFLFGLGIGSTVGSAMASRVKSPRAALGWCQVALCVCMAWTAYVTLPQTAGCSSVTL